MPLVAKLPQLVYWSAGGGDGGGGGGGEGGGIGGRGGGLGWPLQLGPGAVPTVTTAVSVVPPRLKVHPRM